LITFGNRLTVPLHIPSCVLLFDCEDRIEAPPLSFTVPPKSSGFEVHFPFIVVPTKLHVAGVVTLSDEDNIKSSLSDIYDLLGLRVTCLNRSFFIPFGKKQIHSGRYGGGNELPPPASIYPLLKKKIKNGGSNASDNDAGGDDASHVLRVESVPAQPNLLVSFTTSQTPLDDDATVPVHLSDGEIYTIPRLRLENDYGSSGRGKMERLQIVAVGLPGVPDEVLFDTLKKRGKDSNGNDINEDDHDDDDSVISSEFEELMEEDGLPPLRMKALTDALSLDSINDNTKSLPSSGSIVTFQVAAANDMGNQLANGGNVRIRFRYRGPSPNDKTTEIWRRREVGLRIVRVKGPRISSLSFRPDLSWGSAFSELSHALAKQKSRLQAFKKPERVTREHSMKSISSSSVGVNSLMRRGSDAMSSVNQMNDDGSCSTYTVATNKSGRPAGAATEAANSSNDDHNNDANTPSVTPSILNRIGMDVSVNVSGDEVVVLMAVANETNSTIILSNRKGRVGGFKGSPMPTVRVTSGVSVKIPVVIQRIDRRRKNTISNGGRNLGVVGGAPGTTSGGEVVDIVAELIARTALQWQSVVPHQLGGAGGNESDADITLGGNAANNQNDDDDDDGADRRVRHGRVRIPSRCLREIIEEHGSFAPRICMAPVSLSVDIGRKKSDGDEAMVVQCGTFLEVKVEMSIQDWVPEDVISKCALTIEFCCARKNDASGGGGGGGTTISSNTTKGNSSTKHNAAYFWCGQLRRKWIPNSSTSTIGTTSNEDGTTEKEEHDEKKVMKHCAKITFCQSGTFVVSACVKIVGGGNNNPNTNTAAATNNNRSIRNISSEDSAITGGGEEIWWAPRAETVVAIDKQK